MKKVLKFLLVCLGIFMFVGCDGNVEESTPQETPTEDVKKPSISVDDIILDEGDSVEIVVNFENLIEESVEYNVKDSSIAEVSGGYLSALKAGQTTVDVTSESGLTCSFNVTVNAVEKLSAIEKFNLMGAFESTLNQLEWGVSNENVAASYAGDYRSGQNALRLYGGWDDVNSVSLDFNVTLTANLGGIEAVTHTISYYIWQSGTVNVTININGEDFTPTWYKKDGDFNRHVVEFIPNATANVITITIVGTEQPWASIDDLAIIKGVVNDPDVEFSPVTLKVNEEFDLADLVYQTTPADLPLTELTYEVSGSATVSNGKLVAANEAGSAVLIVKGLVNGVAFEEEVNVTVVNVLETTLEAINAFNAIGSFDDETKKFTTVTENAGAIVLETGTSNYRYEIDNASESTYTVTLETTVTGLEAGEYSLNLVACAWFHRADIVVSINDAAIGTFDTYAGTWSNEASENASNLAYDFTVAEGVESIKVTITINVYTWAWGAIDNVSISSK